MLSLSHRCSGLLIRGVSTTRTSRPFVINQLYSSDSSNEDKNGMSKRADVKDDNSHSNKNKEASYTEFASEYHNPVMVETILSYLPKRKKGQQLKICDLTCGGGGHSEAMLMHYVKEGKEYKEGQAKEGQDSTGEVTVYGVDQDEESGKQTRERLGKFMEGVEGVKFMGINKNFGDLNCQDFQGEMIALL